MRDRRPALISAGFAVLLLAGAWVWRPPPAAPCSSILVASSNEKFATLSNLAGEYSSQHPQTQGCVAVRVEKVASGDAESRLAAGWAGSDRPDVWSPAATTWVTLLRQQPGGSQLLPDSYELITQSPLVIGMPTDMATKLGWPATQPSWRDLLLLSQDAAGWSRVGKPEWGQFRLGKTDPRVSTSGLHALMATYYAATGKSADLVAADVASPQSKAFVSGVEASVAHYSDTAENFLRNLRAADEIGNGFGYVSAVTLEEQELWQYNGGQIGDDKPMPPPRTQLAAVYPRDGTLVADHPYLVLNGIGQAKARIANDFLAWLRLGPQQKVFTNAGFRNFKGDQLNTGRGILATEPNSVLIPPAPAVISLIQQSWSQLRKRARILVVVDATTPSLRKGVADALGGLSADDEVGVWVVGPAEKDKPRVIQPIAAAGTDLSRLQAAVLGIAPETGKPPLLAGIESAFTFLKANSDPNRVDAVLVVAGGPNDDARPPDLTTLLKEVRPEIRGTVTRVFGVSATDADNDMMTRIAQASGGVAYTTKGGAGVASAVQRLVAEF